MSEILNELGKVWFSWHFDMFWQITIIISIIICLDLLVRKWIWPQIRYMLWLLILLKLIIPPSFSLSTGFYTSVSPWIKTAFSSRYELLNITPDINRNYSATDERTDSSFLSNEQTASSDKTLGSVKLKETNSSYDVLGLLASLNWQFYLFFIWAFGTLLLFAGLYSRHRKLCLEYRCDRPAYQLPDWFNSLFEQTAIQLKLKKRPVVVITDKLKCPAVAGLLQPLLLLPESYLSGRTRQELKYALMHELAHIKRSDLFIHYLHFIIQIFYWYNPLLWLIRKQVHHMREICCDASIARYLREKTYTYRTILLETARRLLVDAK